MNERRENLIGDINNSILRLAEGSFRGRAEVLKEVRKRTHMPVSPAWLPLLDRLRNGSMRLGALAASLRLSAPVVTRHVQELHARGLVNRTPDETDGRATIVSLTPQGAAIVDEIQGMRLEVLRVVLAGRGDDYLAQAASILADVAEHMALSLPVGRPY